MTGIVFVCWLLLLLTTFPRAKANMKARGGSQIFVPGLILMYGGVYSGSEVCSELVPTGRK